MEGFVRSPPWVYLTTTDRGKRIIKWWASERNFDPYALSHSLLFLLILMGIVRWYCPCIDCCTICHHFKVRSQVVHLLSPPFYLFPLSLSFCFSLYLSFFPACFFMRVLSNSNNQLQMANATYASWNTSIARSAQRLSERKLLEVIAREVGKTHAKNKICKHNTSSF